MILKPFKGASTDRITQPFHKFHRAIDWLPQNLKMPIAYRAYGTPLVAPERVKIGKVYGNKCTPDDTDPLKNGFGLWMKGLETGFEHLYWHTLPILPVNTGDIVERGTIVAYCGNSGNVISDGVYVPLEKRHVPNFDGTHLHQSVNKDGESFDPLTIMDLYTEPTYTALDQLVAISKVLMKISGLLK